MEPIEEERYDRIERGPGYQDPRQRPGEPGYPAPGPGDPGYVDPAYGPDRPYDGAGYYRRSSAAVVRTYNYTAERVVWFLVALIDALIAIRFFMKLLGASYEAGFVQFVYGITNPLVAPFRGIFPAAGQGGNILEPESLVAIVIYFLIGWAIVALIRIATAPRARRTL